MGIYLHADDQRIIVVMRHKLMEPKPLNLLILKITNIHLVPTQFKRMLDSPEPVKEAFVGDSLESVWHGAAPCPASWKRSMLDWFGPKCMNTGSTEGAFFSTIKADDC